MTSPAPHPLDALDAIAADLFRNDLDAAERFLANDFAAVVNQAAGWQVTAADAVLTFARTPEGAA